MPGRCLAIVLCMLTCLAPRTSTAQQIVVTSKPPKGEVQAGTLYGLTRGDFELITRALPTLQLAVPLRQVGHEARIGDRSAAVRRTGTTAQYAESYKLELSRGRFLTTKDAEQLENVAVLNEEAAVNLFGRENPLGKSVCISGHFFLVVGTLKSRDSRDQALEEVRRDERFPRSAGAVAAN